MSIYDSLSNKSRDRDLRVGEYMKICCYLGIEPMEYMKINNSKKNKKLIEAVSLSVFAQNCLPLMLCRLTPH